MEKLRECPFCGKDDELELEETHVGANIICYNCGIGFIRDNWLKSHVIKVWNTRKPDSVGER